MNYNNSELREKAKSKSVRFWEIADKMNISEASMTRLLRKELSEEDKKKIISIIDDISKNKGV